MDSPAKREKLILLSRIPVRASLNAGISKIKKKLSYYPALRLISDGSSPRYIVRGEENEEMRHVFQFDARYITIETYSKISPFYSMGESLLKLLAILSFLSPEYSFSIESLFPYIVVALLNESGKAPKMSAERRDPAIGGGADLMLAKRINELRSEATLLRQKNGGMEALIEGLVSEIVLFEATSRESSIKTLEEKYGISRQYVDGAIGLLKNKGYGITYSSKNSFTVVKI